MNFWRAARLLLYAGLVTVGSTGCGGTQPPSATTAAGATPGEVSVPNVVGASAARAREKLVLVGLRVWVAPESTRCKVLAQSVRPGDTLRRGEAVQLEVNCRAGPGAVCGEVATPRGPATVRLRFGRVFCHEAVRIADAYYNDPQVSPSGTAGTATIGKWWCVGTTGSVADASGEYGNCYTEDERVRIEIRRS